MGYIYIIENLKDKNKYKIGITFILPKLLVFKLNNLDLTIDYKLIYHEKINEKINSLSLEIILHDYLKELKLWEKGDIFNIKKDKLKSLITSLQQFLN